MKEENSLLTVISQETNTNQWVWLKALSSTILHTAKTSALKQCHVQIESKAGESYKQQVKQWFWRLKDRNTEERLVERLVDCSVVTR